MFLFPATGRSAELFRYGRRIDQDRAYVHGLRDADVVSDPRLSATYGKDWLPGVHARQLKRLAHWP
jgi:hypothetical protein